VTSVNATRRWLRRSVSRAASFFSCHSPFSSHLPQESSARAGAAFSDSCFRGRHRSRPASIRQPIVTGRAALFAEPAWRNGPCPPSVYVLIPKRHSRKAVHQDRPHRGRAGRKQLATPPTHNRCAVMINVGYPRLPGVSELRAWSGEPAHERTIVARAALIAVNHTPPR
jgi:hypothetical protein